MAKEKRSFEKHIDEWSSDSNTNKFINYFDIISLILIGLPGLVLLIVGFIGATNSNFVSAREQLTVGIILSSLGSIIFDCVIIAKAIGFRNWQKRRKTNLIPSLAEYSETRLQREPAKLFCIVSIGASCNSDQKFY